VSPFTLNVPSDWIDALTEPLTILFNSNPVTPEAGMLYKPAPSPMNEPEILPELTLNDPVNAVSPSIRIPSTFNSIKCPTAPSLYCIST
jgi:hypothetical protein